MADTYLVTDETEFLAQPSGRIKVGRTKERSALHLICDVGLGLA